LSFFKKLLKIIAIILVIIAIIFIIYAALVAIAGGAIPGSIPLMLGSSTLGASSWAFLAVGLGALAIASIVSPEGFSQAMERIGDAGEKIGHVIGDVTGGVVGGVVKGIGLPLLALGLGAFLLWRRSDSDPGDDENSEETTEAELKSDLSTDPVIGRNRMMDERAVNYRDGMWRYQV
jgi:hypothetical protein